MLAQDVCKTEREGWQCYAQHIGIFLSILNERFAINRIHDDISLRSRERIVEGARRNLIGALYMTKLQMKGLGFDAAAVRMGEIIELVAQSELADPDDRKRIKDKFDEFWCRAIDTGHAPNPTNQAA